MRRVEINENTRMQDLLDAYPFLKDEAIKINEKFRLLDNPIVRALVKNATLKDLSDRAGIPMEQLIGTIKDLLDKHGVQ